MVTKCVLFCPQAFHSNYEVKNYPMKERTEEELSELYRVETMRQIEQADSQVNEWNNNKSGSIATKLILNITYNCYVCTHNLNIFYSFKMCFYKRRKRKTRIQRTLRLTVLLWPAVWVPCMEASTRISTTSLTYTLESRKSTKSLCWRWLFLLLF